MLVKIRDTLCMGIKSTLTRESLPIPFSILPPRIESMFSASMMFISSVCGLKTLRASPAEPPEPVPDEEPFAPTPTETCGNGPRLGMFISKEKTIN